MTLTNSRFLTWTIGLAFVPVITFLISNGLVSLLVVFTVDVVWLVCAVKYCRRVRTKLAWLVFLLLPVILVPLVFEVAWFLWGAGQS
jgi:hypothetical protein